MRICESCRLPELRAARMRHCKHSKGCLYKIINSENRVKRFARKKKERDTQLSEGLFRFLKVDGHGE